MATTYRRAAATTEHAGDNPLCSSAKSRKYFSANGLTGQTINSVGPICPLETMTPLLVAVAETAAILHANSRGSTVSVHGGSLLGHSRFAVSIYPKHSVELNEVPTRDLLFAFVILNADLLLRPDHALGTWFDRQQKRHVIDVVMCPSLIEDAICLGMKHGQKAIFDLKEEKEIPLSRHVELDFVTTPPQEAL